MANQKLTLYRQDTFEAGESAAQRLTLNNDADPRDASLEGIKVVELQFPKFADGRAFSQAFLLRRRMGFQGVIRATGDVLVDQLPQMARTGICEAVLRADQDLAVGLRQLERYEGHYQGDAVQATPRFAEAV